jgi:uncharacterized protein (DUF433 family)
MDAMLSINLITTNPHVRGGRPCIAGTGLRVTDVVIAATIHLQSPEEIAVAYGVSLAGVHAALAYYYGHKETLDEDIRNQNETVEALKSEHIKHGGRSILP